MTEELLTELTDEEVDEYLQFALGNTTGFSKGTANVSARDLKKLRPLIKHYAKMPHPFRACVKDNEKRFGSLTNKYCAIIKDLIVGNTKWRNQGSKKKLSDSTMKELFALDVPDDFYAFLSELEEEEVQTMLEDSIELAEGDVAWDSTNSWNAVTSKIDKALNGEGNVDGSYSDYGMSFWVKDVSSNGTALVCEKGTDYYVVPFSVDKKGDVTIAEESDWKAVTNEWVEEKVGLSDGPHLLAEMYFEGDVIGEVDGDLVWKPILRSGTFAYSPSSKGAAPKPLKIVKDGTSDKSDLTISMDELKSNFEAGAVEHVTIPTSHDDKVDENTGFIRKLRFTKDDEGRDVLEAAMDFTEPDIKGKALRGTIANTSAGVVFDHIHKESGKKFRSVLAHAALTNRPWLNGMRPFGVKASDGEFEVIGFAEAPIDTSERREDMPEEKAEGTVDLKALGFADEESLRFALAEAAGLRAQARERDVTDLCKQWQTDGKTPALVEVAQTIMMADEGASVLNLSEDKKDVALTASDIVKRLVDASTSVKLDQDVVKDKDTSDDEPLDKEENEEELPHDVKVLASQYFFEDSISMSAAVAKAKAECSKEVSK